jgi:magnesium transporter
MGTISIGHTMKVMVPEIKLALLLGITSAAVGACVGGLISLDEPEGVRVSLAVLLAMTTATLTTTFMGVAMPVALYKLGLDPAVPSSPFVTMANDLFGSVFYLLIAMMLF